MRRIYQLPLFFGLLFFGCKHSKIYPNGPFIGKVVSHICSYYVIQLQSGNMDPSLYLKTWTPGNGGGTFHNVFAATNYCYLDSLHLYQNDAIEFYLSSDTTAQTCETCQVFEPAAPSVSNYIKVTKVN
ncbi:MAG TPA: hypothetical protein VHD83_16680 [Puia sp.]|nr:hypothetical protein [Puia sp.]